MVHGTGKTTIAKEIFPILLYRDLDFEKFNLTEISYLENNDENNYNSINYNYFSKENYKEAILLVLSNVYHNKEEVEILDISCGKSNTKKVLEFLKKTINDLDLDYDLQFCIPIQYGELEETKKCLEFVKKLFGCKSNLVFNNIRETYKEFKTYFGCDKWGIKGRYKEIADLVNKNILIPNDSEQILLINRIKKISTFDYLMENYDIYTDMENRDIKEKKFYRNLIDFIDSIEVVLFNENLESIKTAL